MAPQLPPPPLPADTDLRSFPYLPLEVGRLRDSDLAAKENPETCWYAVLLWCAAWHQVPAASLPDDDQVLAQMAGFGRDVKRWKKHRAGALRGFTSHSDGRLYHLVLVKKALEAVKSKLQQRFKTELARIKKHNQRWASQPEKLLQIPTFEEFCDVDYGADVDEDSAEMSIGTGEGQDGDVPSMSRSNRTEQNRTEDIDISPPTPSLPAESRLPSLEDEFDEWWPHYPRKDDRRAALKAYRAARKRDVGADVLLMGVMRYAADCDARQTARQFMKLPATWLNADSWGNESVPLPAPQRRPGDMLTALAEEMDP